MKKSRRALSESASFEVVASRFDRATLSQYDVPRLLQETTFILDGYGSVARPISEELARRGARRFLVTDPKSYVPESVHSQCTADEVGQRKVEVGAKRLQQLGAQSTAFARDISSVPEGVVTPDSIVITTVDNRRGDILSNRRAARMGARLIKINVEPTLEVAAVRAYDFRQQAELCVECQFGDHHYAAQRHPKSCDGGFDERRTNSPRWLSEGAAHLGVMVAIDLAADESLAQDWIAHEWQYSPKTGVVQESRLGPKRNCRWEHARRWPNVVRLREDVTSISLHELIQAAGIGNDAYLEIRFCQQIALRGRCRNCRADQAVVRWFADLQSPVGTCPSCGGPLAAIPFAVFSATSMEPLLGILDQPLSKWGVEPFAVIGMTRQDCGVTFVVGAA